MKENKKRSESRSKIIVINKEDKLMMGVITLSKAEVINTIRNERGL